MITRHHEQDRTRSEALYSDCETYRYALTRIWDDSARRLVFIMLNPSKATEAHNDPTIERCQRRAQQLGFGAFRAVNLFALRETDPAILRKSVAPEGPDNDLALRGACDWGDMILAGWGVHGVHRNQEAHVRNVLRATGKPVHCLGLSKDGHPRHPLYIRYAQPPVLWGAL